MNIIETLNHINKVKQDLLNTVKRLREQNIDALKKLPDDFKNILT